MCEPGQRLLDEQDYVQAYENVREKYKGKNAPAFTVHVRHSQRAASKIAFTHLRHTQSERVWEREEAARLFLTRVKER